jgi:DNA-binding NtrC family response regulator
MADLPSESRLAAVTTTATRVLTVAGTALRFRKCRLTVVDGPDRGCQVVSEQDELHIGSDAGNQLVLRDNTVSRHHCRISATEAGFLLRDLGSTNGTVVNGMRVQSALLDASVELLLGKSVVRFEILDEEISAPLSEIEHFGPVLGASPLMRRLFALLPRIASADTTVLIEGETGTGKGLLAEAIHQASPRASGPFVEIDCGAIPPNLIESELLGHERGSFTGAHATRIGAFEVASGGTIFLDEIGELPLDMQPKLLRVLERRQVKRIGSDALIPVDVRIIAATNRNLHQEVNHGRFRQDLFYRLHVVKLRVPALRERRGDVPLLASHFYRQFVGADDARPPAALLATLLRHDWPGNIRELRNAIERSVLLGDPALWQAIGASGGAADQESELTVQVDENASFRAAKEQVVSRWERAYVRELLERHEGNLSQAARAVRMDRNHLRELLRRHQIKSEE